MMKLLHADWKLVEDGKAIRRELRFPDFWRTMSFVNALAHVANVEDHHPDLEVGYNYCRVRYSTHAIGGLSDNDFICAAKADALLMHATATGIDAAHRAADLRLLARHRLRVVRLLPLRHARRVLLGALLPARQRHRGLPREPRDLRRGIRGAPARRARLRPHRRPGRPQVHLPDHDRRDGPLDGARRRAADLCADRHLGAGPAGQPAPRAGPRARRRIRRRGDLRRRARAARASAATTRAGSRPRRRSDSSCRSP